MRLVPSLIFGLLCVAGTRGADGLKPIELEVTVRAPLAAAWEAWATNDGAQKWFAPRTNIELKPGGAYEILFAPDKPAGERGAEDLHVLCYLPREMLAFEWNAPPQFAKARPQRTWVVLRFSDLGDGTVRMRLSHAGFAERAAAHADERAEWEQVHAYFTKAWPTVLGNLRKHLEKDAAPDESRQVCEAVIEAPIADVWHVLTTKEGTEKWEFAHAEFDLRVGGTMRTHYSKNGKIGDPGTIENTFLALEPNRMFAIRVGKAPERFPFKEAIKSVWHVCYLEEAGLGRTRVRIVGLGYGADEESKKMRAFFEKGNNYTLKKLQEHFAAKATDKP